MEYESLGKVTVSFEVSSIGVFEDEIEDVRAVLIDSENDSVSVMGDGSEEYYNLSSVINVSAEGVVINYA